ncbi:MAG: hypothetical protein NC396_00840 [Bacteroides sp.]|nr:hypothetical protein [Bacteroides sp.]MCM1084868.1 hypothetical protein [Bacteroides sp.]
MKDRFNKNLILLVIALFGLFGAKGQNAQRTPLVYLYCAAESDFDKQEGGYTLPWYIRQMKQKDFSVLDTGGVYRDVLTGYGGAVFVDERDSTIILTHFATETETTDVLDILADIQIAGVDWLAWPVYKIADVMRDSQSAQEMRMYGMQYPSARKFYQMVKERWPDFNIENTGHSLGGNLTQLISYEYGIVGVTFDPAGIGVSVHLDSLKKDNARYITNYKICKSLISSAVTTGQRVGKTVTIYPSDGKSLWGTKAHGLMEIYTMAMNKETGYFKTLDEVSKEIWRNNGSIRELQVEDKYKPVLEDVKVRDKFGTYDEYLVYMKAKYGEADKDVFPDKPEQSENRVNKILRLLKETDLLKIGSDKFLNR